MIAVILEGLSSLSYAMHSYMHSVAIEICAEAVAPSYMVPVRTRDDTLTLIRLVVSKQHKPQPQGFGPCKVDAT